MFLFFSFFFSISQIQLAYGVPMHVPFPYFYSPNGSKGHHFPSASMNNNEVKSNVRRGMTSPENSSSPINFSSTIQNAVTFNNHLNKSIENSRRSRSVSNEEKTRDQQDDDNIEVD